MFLRAGDMRIPLEHINDYSLCSKGVYFRLHCSKHVGNWDALTNSTREDYGNITFEYLKINMQDGNTYCIHSESSVQYGYEYAMKINNYTIGDPIPDYEKKSFKCAEEMKREGKFIYVKDNVRDLLAKLDDAFEVI